MAGMGGNSGVVGTYRSFGEFYPFYLSQHPDRTCRRLHFVGTSLGLAAVARRGHAKSVVAPGRPRRRLSLCLDRPFYFEKNRPATFTYPLYSFMGDWVMWKEMLTGHIRF